MRAFDFVQPPSIPATLELLARHGEDARILAGGQSLLILLRQRLLAPAVVVDIKAVPELEAIADSADSLRVGATATYASVARSPRVRERWPLLAEAAGSVASIHIRERGTIGGSLSHADPAGDVPTAMMALDATVVTAGPNGGRRMPASHFPTGLFTTALRPGELLTSVELPAQPPGATYGYRRFHVREGEFPLTQTAIRLEWDGTRCVEARVAVGGGFDRPARLPEVEAWLAGTDVGDDLADEFVGRVRAAVRPFADVRGSAEWKARVVAAIAGRAFRSAVEDRRRANG